ITLRVRQWLAPLESTTQASALNPLSRASSPRSEPGVVVWLCTQAPLALPPSPNSKKYDRGSPSGSLLLHRSKVTDSGDGPWGGSGLVLSTANGGGFPAVVGRVVVVLAWAT